MDLKKFQDMSTLVDKISKDSCKKMGDIIENELKIVSEKYNIPPENLTLQIYPNDLYVISVKIAAFTITTTMEIT